MVTFIQLTPSDIENLIQRLRDSRLDKIAATEEMLAVASDNVKGMLVKRLKRLRSIDYSESKEVEFQVLREDLALDPASRLRVFLDYYTPDARKSWHDRDELWCEEYEMLPLLAEIDTLLSFGEVEQAFVHMRDNWEPCFSEAFDVTAPCWADVKITP